MLGAWVEEVGCGNYVNTGSDTQVGVKYFLVGACVKYFLDITLTVMMVGGSE